MPNSKPSVNNEIKDHKAQTTHYPDAITLLIADHKEVKNYFEQYQKLIDQEAESKELTSLAHTICLTLTIHAQIEEEHLYPLLRKTFETTELINESAVEHATVKSLIDQILTGDRRDSLYDAKVKVLAEYVEHHVREEEDEIFPKAKKLKVDLNALGEKLTTRKVELLASTQGSLETPSAADKRSNKDQLPDNAVKETIKSNPKQGAESKSNSKTRSV